MLKPDLTLKNYSTFFSHPMYFKSMKRTLEVTAIVTAISILIGYPTAYFIALGTGVRFHSFLLFMVILPSWSSLLIRSFSWMSILRDDGLLNSFLKATRIVPQPPTLLYTETGVIVGLLHIYLPFMIMPIYSSLKNLDLSLLEAAKDLGANAFRAFLRVTLPLSFSGIITGTFLVALPVFGAFITPKILGGTKDVMIGNLVEIQFKEIFNWPFGAAVGTIVTLLVLVTMFLFNKYIGAEQLYGPGKGR
jgi:spermidine/putrescine transport system permease protein